MEFEEPVRELTVSPMGIVSGYAKAVHVDVVPTLDSGVSSQWDSVLSPSLALSLLSA
jgi:hypothetical protein